jgi:hypothetical protein
MRTSFNPVQLAGRRAIRLACRIGRLAPRALVVACAVALLLLFDAGSAIHRAASAEQAAPGSRVTGTPTDHPAASESPATIDGFREAHFGMTEDQVREAIKKDFPAVAAKLKVTTHPSDKTAVLSVVVPDLLPHTGNARLFYILGYKSKKLIQVNVSWTSEGTEDSDEIVVGAANSLRDYFATQNYKPDSVVVNRQLAENTMLVFRASDLQNRTVVAVLSGVGTAARKDEKAPRPPPLALELSYIADAAHPDVFKIGKGQF